MNIYQRPKFNNVVELLATNGLPTADITASSLENFLGCGEEANPSGIIGLEITGNDGLLRSLAVTENARGMGYGKALIARLEQFAKQKGVHDLYLLTDTAEEFFKRQGYEQIERNLVSEEIKRTKEYSSLCTEDAVVMRKALEI